MIDWQAVKEERTALAQRLHEAGFPVSFCNGEAVWPNGFQPDEEKLSTLLGQPTDSPEETVEEESNGKKRRGGKSK